MSDTETTNGTPIPVEVTNDEMRVYGGKVWTENNDGENSGLEADTLDNLDSTQFLRSDIENTGNSQFVDVTASGSFYGDLVGSADHAVNADNATNAQDAVNAQNAVNAQDAQHAVSADNATNAGTVDGLNGSQFLRSDIENAGNSQFVDMTASGKFYGDLVGTADNATTLDNYPADLSSTPNTIALRNSTGDVYAQQFKSDAPNETTIDPSAALAFRNNNTDDNGIRFIEDNAEVRDWLETLSIDEIQAILALKADKSDTYTKSDVDTALSSKADTSHTHTASDIVSGTLSGSRLPRATSSTHGAIKVRLDGKTAYFTTNGSNA